ncbi:hypothetical protein JCM19992_27620 [Thermostilla marina]
MRAKIARVGLMLFVLGLGIAIGIGFDRIRQDRKALADDNAPAQQQTDEAKPVKKVMRVGQVIGLRPEKRDYYIKLHANTWPGVLKRIHDSNIRNYSIYLAELEGKLYLFSYFEYVGDDFEADMAKIAADPETQRWWKETDPCQIRLPDTPEGSWWKPIPEVFHTD